MKEEDVQYVKKMIHVVESYQVLYSVLKSKYAERQEFNEIMAYAREVYLKKDE